MTADWQSALERARAHAPFLRRALERQPELAELLARGAGEEALAFARQVSDSAAAATALRREKLALATALAIGDLAGAFPLLRVTGELSDFADRALDRAMATAVERRVGEGSTAGFIGLALGKHGARELNYSSDIDPILLFDPDRLPRRDRDEPGEAAQRYAREVVRLLSDATAEGYVFRVDLRLRPASEVSPLAIPLGAALTHYESLALTWERAAFIRARAAAGDIAAGEDFLAAIRAFVWRRSLDFGAIEEISRLTARIREANEGPTAPGPGFDLKKGRGGIREIEFFVQTHQLVHGGRQPSLRVRGTRAGLDALAQADLIAGEDARLLGDAYDRLRTVEHRVQMIDDRQTHVLPDGAALDGVARLDGMADAGALLRDLSHHCAIVGERFDRLLETTTSPADAQTAGNIAKLVTDAGINEAGRVADRIEGWLDGRYRALRSTGAKDAFRAIVPHLVEALGEASDPDQALLRWERLLANLPSAINLFRLLDARPGLFDQLSRILSLAPPLADALGRRPALLDSLIDRTASDLPPSVDDIAGRMRPVEADASYEVRLDRIRVVTGDYRFALGTQLIEATQDPLAIAAGLGRVAEAALVVACSAAEEEFAQAHGRIEGGELVVLGLGRFGGKALTHASDLDLVYLFTGDHGAESDGERPLGATLYFNRLAQRVTAALSVPTAQGALYEIDTRLRPQSNQGPLAASLDAFARYQGEDAWTWEHMALTRARAVAGSPAARAAVETVIDRALRQERAPEELRDRVLRMRDEMARHKPAGGPLDAKLARGGLVDLEFLIHYLQLRDHVAFDPHLGTACGMLAEQGLVPRDLCEAHDFLTRLLVAARLLAPDLTIPTGPGGAVLARACGCESPTALLDRLANARRTVAAAWCETFGRELEQEER
ncbi:bifunctional [glutamate--ammonia ligase]-adenylyl-L-tyrosine phosphorylase/[glutamate--ammonia-ligase] adenylyltransferase [Erythrobacter sp. LQ02-29]|uniref:bifunctional [glutamate--ammonia ligase]-adenylyl-L-tyrosine phosphorylase/[glutamate--ammonia-ligase] adenylyltransferase n=1 Tax=Erythrobacter sp. LQ02-29 TaxID=2920384 RepID=UPI001F4D40B7|nr:bifunctional [glutamate--ammonia ligase]-adenylyl-L-tyrosine phosphorylase/[glutamate--ammonia-ligase] adenylyltransferase [Erythrobacter sp. LQ02-29]MCP9221960.1 bifunctional [glutamate--ammonia ligase]-adenylyl-L-tyrosine phosphorylase/[glutamate--ammonia-ligase] adenylyltransferase [Erythrobacter sp. LQ02-29]